ncbi:MAG: ATP-binding protein [Amphritea sp.]|nr:ATP-binding protein [Amphritea sp.]
MSETEAYKQAWLREKQARLAAEELLEVKARDLYLANQQLMEQNQLLKEQQALMIRNEKLATLGTLSAGVAHEINNPLAFVLSNMDSLKRYTAAYNSLLELNTHWQSQNQLPPALAESLAALIEEQDLEFVAEDIQDLLRDTDEGLIRLRDIVQSLRHFSHGGNSERTLYNLTEGLDSTLKVLQNELKQGINVNCLFEPIPPIHCNPGEMNQVFLNLIMNACQALEQSPEPQIFITTATESGQDREEIVIRIKDNGCGIPQDKLESVFDPFFTTKPVGKGTGMGLSIAYGILNEHGGNIIVNSAEGKGTCFEIRLPVEEPQAD